MLCGATPFTAIDGLLIYIPVSARLRGGKAQGPGRRPGLPGPGADALAAATGAPGKARDLYTRALHLARDISSAKDEADALDGIATTCRLQDDTGQARTYFRQARALYLSLGCADDAARIQDTLDRLENG
jgi:tetratricopeptide (TPR) repeat protein